MEIIVEHVKGCIFSADPEKLPQAQNSSLYKQNPTLFTENWNKYKDLINAGYEANVEIKYNPEYQFYGCYTLSSIKSGELIGLYAGEIWELQELNHILEEKYSKMHPSLCPEQIQSYRWNLPYEHPTNPAIKYVVDAFACRNITAFINHSDKPNCAGIYATDKRHWYVVYIATQDIKAGQELLADYGEEYWLQRKNEKKDLSYASTKLSENPIHQSNKLPEIDSKGTLENQKSTHTFLRVP